MIFFYDKEDFRYDVIQYVGDFIGEMIIDLCDITNSHSDRKPFTKERAALVVNHISGYLHIKEPSGLKNWRCIL